MKLRLLHLLLVAGFLAVSGLVHGMWTNRWSAAATVEGKNLLDGLEGNIGSWQPGEALQIDPAEIPAKAVCHSRRFLPVKTGKPLVVSVTSGSPGVIAVHTPDVCYLGAGYKLKGAVTRQTIPLGDGKGEASFWVGDFVKTTATGAETLRVRWAWTTDGNWQAPDFPRLTFAPKVSLFTSAGSTVLYKLYIVHPLSDEDDLTRDDPYRKFLADLIPALNRQLPR